MGLPTDNQTGATDAGPTDAELVAATLGGDRLALAAIYDRYTDRIHTMCVHMLGDRDEAADACGEVFLVAFQRLDQLRDPARLRPWLYAICRNEVYRRTRRRSRVRLVEEVSEMDAMVDHDVEADDIDPAALALLVREAAAGLDDRDRLVLELQLQGLEGDELALALGTSVSTSYQHVHRMRERMGRSVGALLVARQGRRDCDDLDRLLAGWDGRFSVLWRKRVARHVDGCDVCTRRRTAVPAALFGTAGASPLLVTPTSVRDRVLAGAPVGGSGVASSRGRRWPGDGFPPAPPPSRRRLLPAAVIALFAVAAALLVWTATGDDPADVATGSVGDVTSTTSIATTAAPVAPTAVPDSSTSTTSIATTAESTAPAVAPTTAPPRPTTTPAPTTSTPKTTSTTTSTTTTPPTTTTAVPPTLRLSGPTVLFARASNGGPCANQQFTANVTSAGAPSSVTLRWTAGAATGSVAMTRNRSRNGWNATLDLPFGTTGGVVVVAEATSGGATGRSNTLTATASPCPVIG